MSLSAFYYEQMHSLEFAIKYSAQALINAKEEMPNYALDMEIKEQDFIETSESLEVLEENMKFWKERLA